MSALLKEDPHLKDAVSEKGSDTEQREDGESQMGKLPQAPC